MDNNEIRLVVLGLPYDTSEEDVRAIIEPYGPIGYFSYPVGFEGGHRGYAFFGLDPQMAEQAMREISQLERGNQGRRLRCELARPRESRRDWRD